MSKGGIGVGSASIVLVFAVLCLTIFSLISLSSASGDQALSDAELSMVEAYYTADTEAERVLSALLSSYPFFDDYVLDIEIESNWESGSVCILSYACPISTRKELAVEVRIAENSFDILKWRMQDVVIWVNDQSVPVWTGTPIWG